jgi:hypothetical protein
MAVGRWPRSHSFHAGIGSDARKRRAYDCLSFPFGRTLEVRGPAQERNVQAARDLAVYAGYAAPLLKDNEYSEEGQTAKGLRVAAPMLIA